MKAERRSIINEWSETDPMLSRADDNSQLSRWLETRTNAAMHTCIEVMETTTYTNGAGVTTAGRKVDAIISDGVHVRREEIPVDRTPTAADEADELGRITDWTRRVQETMQFGSAGHFSRSTSNVSRQSSCAPEPPPPAPQTTPACARHAAKRTPAQTRGAASGAAARAAAHAATSIAPTLNERRPSTTAALSTKIAKRCPQG